MASTRKKPGAKTEASDDRSLDQTDAATTEDSRPNTTARSEDEKWV